MNIQYIEHKAIDTLKWNSCIHYAHNGNPYGFTWYLDNIAPKWNGLVEVTAEGYVSVMPLPYNTKLLGIKQLYQPFFTQQLGIYSVNILSQKRIQSFLSAIPDEFKYIDLNLNEKNKVKPEWGFQTQLKPNLLLDLNQPYDSIAANYSTNLKRNLKKASKYNLSITNSLKPETVIQLFWDNVANRIKPLKDFHFHALHRIMYNAMHRGRGFLSGVLNEDGKLIAAAYFMASHHRIINLLPSSTPEGRAKGAMHFLLDIMMRTNAGRPLVFDFEGSSIESIAKFYKSFGATEVFYPNIKRNQLPFGLRWRK